MKRVFIQMLAALWLISLSTALSAQNDNNTSEELNIDIDDADKVKIIKIDDGDKKVYEWNGEGEMPKEIKDILDRENIDLDNLENIENGNDKTVKVIRLDKSETISKEIDIEIDDTKKIKVIQIDGGDKKILEWDGDSEMPKEIEKILKSEGIEIDKLDGSQSFNSTRLEVIELEDIRELENLDSELSEDILRSVEAEIEKLENSRMDGESQSLIKVKIIQDGQEKIIEWDGEGEPPAALLEQIEISEDGSGVNIFTLDSENGLEAVGLNSEDGEQKSIIIKIDDQEHGLFASNRDRPSMGISINDGLKILHVLSGQPAHKAGLKPGDKLLSIDGESLGSLKELFDKLDQYETGDIVKVEVLRFKKNRSYKVRLADRPESRHEHKTVKIIKRFENSDKGSDYEMPNSTLKLKEFNVYPNPTDGEFELKFRAKKTPTIVQIVSMDGRTVYKEQLDDFKGNYAKKINLDLAPQALVIHVIQKNRVYTEQLIIQ